MPIGIIDKIFNVAQILEFLRNNIVAVLITISALIAIATPAVYFFLKWKRKARERIAARGMPKKALVRVWRAFLKQIPREFRRSILRYQPFVVLGESGTGKTLVISRYTDWAGQAAQFYPSYAADPQLQIYLGSRALVQEVPATLLRDTSPRARAALLRLWSKTFKKREPIVVITLSAGGLRSMAPDALRMHAQTLRGKINIISRIRGAPVRTRIVLTHMDQVEGFLAFSSFLEKQGIPLQVDLSAARDEEAIQKCLVPYEKYLPLALTTLPVKAYMKALTFLTKAPQTFSYLSIVLNTLREPDPLSFEPDVRELFLTSDTSGSPSALANPFASDWAEEPGPLEIEKARRRHRVGAAAVAALGTVYLLAGYVRERGRWEDARAAIERFDQAREPALAREAHDRIARLAGTEREDWLDAVLPRFFSRAQIGLGRRFADAIRRNYLVPMLDAAMTSPDAHERTLFLLATLYASRDSELGRLVGEFDRRGELSDLVGLPTYLIDYYVRHSAEAYGESVRLRTLPYQRRGAPAYDPQPWVAFLVELTEALERPYLTPAHLDKLRAGAERLFALVTRIRRHQFAQLMFRALEQVPQVDVKSAFETYLADLEVPFQIQAQSEALRDVLDMVRRTKLDVPAMSESTLATLIYELKGLGDPAAAGEGGARLHAIALGGRGFTIEERRWEDLVRRSRTRLLVQGFIHEHEVASERAGSSLLMADLARQVARPIDAVASDLEREGTLYPAIRMKPAGRSEFLFAGRGAIRGPYTRAAYEREIKPVVEQFGQMIDSLALDPDVRQELSAFVLREVEKYASDYAAEVRRYYESWDVRANSLGGLLLALDQMKLPKSPITDFLQTIAEQTSISESDSPYLQPMAERLRPFQYVNRLLVARKDAPPEIDWYRQILGRISADLQGQLASELTPERAGGAGAGAGAGASAPTEFEQGLTQLGRLSFKILHDHRDSYLRLVREWLQKNGIDGEEWRRPFVLPVLRMHELGLGDLEEAVRERWRARVTPRAALVLGRFPFNGAAEKEATPLEVEEAFHPKGAFWTAFRALIAPLCVEDRDGFRPMPGTDVGFAWPAGMFPAVNHLARLSAALWDRDGNPKPIQFSIQPQPLPVAESETRAVVLSYLGAGSAGVFGFNQRPAWTPLAWEWWKSPPAHVGIQLASPEDDREKAERSIVVSESLWAFLRLLQKGQVLERNTWTWTLSDPELRAPVKVKFAFRENPWELFSVPLDQERADASR